MNKKSENTKSQRIQVFARCRPLNSLEKKQGSPSVVEVVPERKEIHLKDRNNVERQFAFDKVFPPDTNQITVYKSVVEPLIKEVLMGYNCTVFAYGQTGTGKTYTMEGERSNTSCSWEDDPCAGIIPRSIHQLFEELNKEENIEFSVSVSFLEIYNEDLFDLLSCKELSKQSAACKVSLFEDANRKGSVYVSGLEKITVNNKDEVYSILERGSARRQTAATLLNAHSSRSHTIFMVTAHIKENTLDGEELVKTGKLNLVDLAGSENVGRSGAIDKRAREAGNINQSLLTLGRVITALIEKQPHVPYRESKLTRLLKDSLGGHTKTSLIATITPALCNFDETSSTLDYATKAKSIIVKPEANQKTTKRALMRELNEIIQRQTKDIAALQAKNGVYMDPENFRNTMEELEGLNKKIINLTEEHEKLLGEFDLIREQNGTLGVELSKMTQKCDMTEVELCNTRQNLHHVKEVLANTTLDRDEKEVLLNLRKKFEQRLSQQAQKILQVADETTGDIHKLHDKVDRKRRVELTNEERCQEYRENLQKQCISLFELISEREENEESFKESLDETMNAFITQSKAKLKERKNVIKNLNELGKATLQEFPKSLAEEVTHQKQWACELQENTMNKQAVFSSLIRQSHDLYQNLNKIIDDIVDTSCNTIKTVYEKVNQRKESVGAQMIEAKELLKSVSMSLDSVCQGISAVSDDYRKQVQAAYAYQSEKEKEREKIKKLREKLRAEEDELRAKLRAEEDKLRAELRAKEERICAEEEALHTEVKTNMNNLLQSNYASQVNGKLVKMEPIQKTLSEIQESIKDQVFPKLQELGDITATAELEITSKGEAIRSTQLSVSAEVKGVLLNCEEVETEQKNFIETTIEQHKLNLERNYQNHSVTIQNISESSSKLVDSTLNFAKESCKTLQYNMDQVKHLIERTQQEELENTAQIKRGILQVERDVEKFISEDLVRDIPTGVTPMRKNYDYPKRLVVSSPDERLLQRLRAQVASTEAQDLPLDGSFTESDDCKDTASEAASHNASLTTSEEYDSTGENDSVTSSVSDASVESGKNKENCKHNGKSASKLPKRLPKGKGFVKPHAPSNGRKPLVSTNSSDCSFLN